MRIINPTFGLTAAAGPTIALKSINWATDAIALMSNSKPNARELLEGMKAKLGAFRNVDNIVYHSKNSASQAAPKDQIQMVAKRPEQGRISGNVGCLDLTVHFQSQLHGNSPSWFGARQGAVLPAAMTASA